jgi:subtilisin family serine protease
MNQVICPNCRTVTPPWRYCAKCNAPLDYLLSQSAFEQPGAKPCSMDPHLHRLVQRVRDQGISKLKTASTNEDWVTVIAKIKDPSAFKALEKVVVGTEIPPVSNDNPSGAQSAKARKSQKHGAEEDDLYTIVTARMPVEIVEYVRRQPFVYSLKAGQRIRPWLETARKDTNAASDPQLLYASPEMIKSAGEPYGQDGEGVIVGIVDFGMDFMHKNFRDDNGSRILALWDQTAPGDSRFIQPFGYGRLYTKGDIGAAIEASEKVTEKGNAERVCAAAYRALGYEPPADSLFQVGAHGTYVADVAVGNGNGTGKDAAGYAPKADIVFVEISTQPGAPMVGQSFGDSAQLLEAVKFIFDYAGDRPCVINLSLGTNGGPHDGTTLVEEAIDRLLSDPEKPNRAVVVAAGNANRQRLHVSGKVAEGESVEIGWVVPKNDSTANEMEIWYSKDDRFTVEVFEPGPDDKKGKKLATVAPGWQVDLSDNYRGLMTIINRLDDPNNHNNTINVFFESGLEPGNWTLELHGTIVKKGDFHAWIERDETGQARFLSAQGQLKTEPEKKPVPKKLLKESSFYKTDDRHTLSSIACGEKTIVVGSYDARSSDKRLAQTTSSGPSLNKKARNKPDLSAPGEFILAAHSRTLVMRNRASGTSLAAPVVTGIVASMLSVAKAHGAKLSASEILRILIESSQKDVIEENIKETEKGWHPRYGYGRVSKQGAIDAVLAEVSPKSSKSTDQKNSKSKKSGAAYSK